MAVRDVVQAAAGVGGGGEYVEDVFSTYLYAGNNGSQTIENGVDLAGEGGMVWMKSRNATYNHGLMDTARGTSSVLCSNLSDAAKPYTDITSFNSNGFTLGFYSGWFNSSGSDYASWSFRKSPKFFDVVTWTGTGSATTIPHNLGSVPGMIIVKRTDSTGNWAVYHRSLTSANHSLLLNLTGAQDETGYFANTAPTDTEFSVGVSVVNNTGGTYVAYLFAHDAGGFGDDGEQNVISCGSVAGQQTINLGWEPQWLLMKRTDSAGDWRLVDAMRGLTAVNSNDAWLAPNTSAAESASDFLTLNSTGFFSDLNGTYIYIAIRRPMKTPESGTEVLYADATTASTNAVTTTGFPVDLQIGKWRTSSDVGQDWSFTDRLRGLNTISSESYVPSLRSTNTNEEAASLLGFNFTNTTYKLGSYYNGMSKVFYNLRRAPGFMDVVAYTGTGVAHTEAHNLGVAPEMMIVKKRSGNGSWCVYHEGVAVDPETDYLFLESTDAASDSANFWNDTAPTSTNFTVGTSTGVNLNGETFIAYLFATLDGVSKVGSYVGNGTSQTIDCGFSTGARFVLLKRYNANGYNWQVFDTARGITVGNDAMLALNTTAAESVLNWGINPNSAGFEVTGNGLNETGGEWLFYAIA